MYLYIVIFFCLVVLELIYFKIADKFNIIDKPNLRSSHDRITLRGGGVVFVLAMWLYSIIYGFNYPWFMLGITAISVVSFIDDIRSIPNKFRIVVHFLSMLFMFYDLGLFTYDSWWQIILALIVCTGILNAYNFMDGINGITGGYSLAVLLPLVYVNSKINFIDVNFLYVSIISVIVFNIFNFRNKAKCFAGDVGAMGIAFIIIFALGRLIIKTQDISFLIFLFVYGVDSVMTILHRLILKENIFEAHRKHVYQLMANELHISHVNVSLFYMLIQLLISYGMIILYSYKWTYFIIVLVFLGLNYILFKKKYYYLHKEYLKSKGNADR